MITRRTSLQLLAGVAAGVAAGAVAGPIRPAAADDDNDPARVWTVTGQSTSSQLEAFDSKMEAFMKPRHIEYGSLAVVNQDKLVLARGYNWTSNTTFQAQPTSLFRIASLTKSITATAIMLLVQEGSLSLSDKVAPMLGLSNASDQYLDDITVLNLLQHQGGWKLPDTDPSIPDIDPMFLDFTIASTLGVPLPINKQHIMDYTTAHLPTVFQPGTDFSYTNYGYLLLGKVIETVTGQPYATYVQQNVLSPVNISRMVQGRTASGQRKSTEVTYDEVALDTPTVLDGTGTDVPWPYGGFNLENMEAHGAWLSSAVDMAKFNTIFDGPGVLTSSSIAQMLAPPASGMNPDQSWYGMGWAGRLVANGTNYWHTGSMPGTWTLMIRRYDDLKWVAMFNQRNDSGDSKGETYGQIDNDLHDAANSVIIWPTTDLFPSYGL
jgi:CubicO group peptidase (beta-lactamase class C family)